MKRLILLALLCAPAFADDEVVLKNGDKLTGRVVGMAKGKLVFETKAAGTLAIAWDQIASIRTDAKVRVKLTTGEMLDGKLSAGDGGLLKIESEVPAAPVQVDLAKVTHLNEPPTAWHGSVDIAARATDGNTHTRGLLVAAEGTRATENDRLTLKALFKFSETGGETIERSAFGLGKYQYHFSERLYAYVSVELFHDKFKDLRLRTIVSAGGGYVIHHDETWTLTAELGLAYVDNDFDVSEDESHLGGRLNLHARVALPLGFEIVEDFTYYPNFDESSDWQVHNELTVGRSLGGGWTFKAGWILDYDHEPPLDLEKHDDTYFVGLGYRF